MSFASPLLLLALLTIPVVAALWWWLSRRPARYAVEYPNLELLAIVAGETRSWRHWAAPGLLLLALAVLGLGLARPQVEMSVASDDATVVLALDSSGSMRADDVAPTRLAAARSAVRTFLEAAPDDLRVGMVTFAAQPQLVAPVSRDHSLVLQSLDFLYPGRGTNIGDSVAQSAEIARDAVGGGGGGGEAGVATFALRLAAAAQAPPPAAVLLLSDGFQTDGFLTPQEGAQRAKELGIPVYTIALGTDEGIVEFTFGGVTRRIPVPPDRDSLRQIAQITGGEFYDAPTAEALQTAYEDLGERLGREPEEVEATVVFLGAGAFLLVAGAALSLLWGPRLP